MNKLSTLQSLFSKILCVLLISLVFGFGANAQGTFYTPSIHVTGEYLTNCAGQVKIKCLYQDVGDWGINNLEVYYKNSSGTYIKIMSAVNNWTYDYDWSDHWAGSSRNYSFRAEAGFSITNQYKKNEGDLHYFDFLWNNIPADAYVGGIITLSSSGSNGLTTWSASTSNNSIVQYPILIPPTSLSATDGVHCDKVALTWTLPGSFPCSYSQQIYKNNTLLTTVSGTTSSFDDTNVGN